MQTIIIIDKVNAMQRNLVMVLIGLALAGTGCGAKQKEDQRLEVVATTTQVADLVRAVGGSAVKVTQILQPNADPHSYEPHPSDAKAIANADVIFSSGGDVDEWLKGLIDNSGSEAPHSVLIDKVKTLRGEESDVDPHWWQDPRNGIRAVNEIELQLSAVDPSRANDFGRNAKRYNAQLTKLDAAIGRCMRSIPAARRKFVGSHDALGYFTERYNIALSGAAVPSLSTQAQSSAGETKRLVDRIKKERISAIFPESSVSSRLEEAIANEAGIKLGKPLWVDALGPAGSSGSTYLGSLRSNALALADGFTGGKAKCRLPT